MLKPKQEKFVHNLIKGMSQRQAYKDAYGANYDDAAIDNKAYKLFKRPEVKARYNEIMEELKNQCVMSAFEKRQILKEIVFDPETGKSDKIKAIDVDNKMTGEYVTKLEGNLKVDKLEDLL